MILCTVYKLLTKIQTVRITKHHPRIIDADQKRVHEGLLYWFKYSRVTVLNRLCESKQYCWSVDVY